MKSQSGVLMVEVVIAMIAGSSILLGLGLAYANGLLIWQRSVEKMGMQDYGSHAVSAIGRVFQAADSIGVGQGSVSVLRRIGNPINRISGKSVLRIRDGELYLNDSMLVPEMGPRDFLVEDLVVSETEVPFDKSSALVASRVRFRLVRPEEKDRPREEMEFESVFFPRNGRGKS